MGVTQDTLVALATSVDAALTPSYSNLTVMPYRADPIGRNGIEFMLSVSASQAGRVSLGIDPNSNVWEIIGVLHVPYLKGTGEAMALAEFQTNEICDVIKEALPLWRSSTNPTLYPWLKAVLLRPVLRPPSPPHLKQYRLAQFFFGIYA